MLIDSEGASNWQTGVSAFQHQDLDSEGGAHEAMGEWLLQGSPAEQKRHAACMVMNCGMSFVTDSLSRERWHCAEMDSAPSELPIRPGLRKKKKAAGLSLGKGIK